MRNAVAAEILRALVVPASTSIFHLAIISTVLNGHNSMESFSINRVLVVLTLFLPRHQETGCEPLVPSKG
jgi:hypothetical protein